jgi:hypothetical protein
MLGGSLAKVVLSANFYGTFDGSLPILRFFSWLFLILPLLMLPNPIIYNRATHWTLT